VCSWRTAAGLAIDARLTPATGKAEHEAALAMPADLPGTKPRTLGADKTCDTANLVADCRDLKVTPRAARSSYEYDTRSGTGVRRESRIDRGTTRHPGYASSQEARKMIETPFGDGKQHAGTIREVETDRRAKVAEVFTLAMLGVGPRRLPRLFAAQVGTVGSGQTGEVRPRLRFARKAGESAPREVRKPPAWTRRRRPAWRQES
jgi:hypothetical protein